MALEIKIDLTNATQDDVHGLIAMLQTWDQKALGAQVDAMERDAVRRPIPSQLPVEVPATMTGETPILEAARPTVAGELEARGFTETQTEAMTVDKPKRGRPKKVQEVAQEQVDPTTSATSTEKSEASPSTPASVEAPSLDDLRSALQAHTQAHSLESGIALVKSFGVSRVSELAELPAEKQIEFMEKARA